jgi:hypothetical protein
VVLERLSRMADFAIFISTGTYVHMQNSTRWNWSQAKLQFRRQRGTILICFIMWDEFKYIPELKSCLNLSPKAQPAELKCVVQNIELKFGGT